jgi:hypothetical protein
MKKCLDFRVFFYGAAAQVGPRPPRCSRFLYYYQSDTCTRCRTPLNEGSALRRGYCLHNKQQLQETNTHAFSGFRTRNPSNRAVADLRLIMHSHRNRRLSRICMSYCIACLLSAVFDLNMAKIIVLVQHHRHRYVSEVAS